MSRAELCVNERDVPFNQCQQCPIRLQLPWSGCHIYAIHGSWSLYPRRARAGLCPIVCGAVEQGNLFQDHRKAGAVGGVDATVDPAETTFCIK